MQTSSNPIPSKFPGKFCWNLNLNLDLNSHEIARAGYAQTSLSSRLQSKHVDSFFLLSNITGNRCLAFFIIKESSAVKKQRNVDWVL